MNTYRNTKTGAIIEIPSELCGGLWVKVEETKPATPVVAEEKVKAPAKKATTKKGSTK